MPDSSGLSFKGYENPLDLVDRTELPYEERLALLQEWQAEAARSGQPDERREAIHAAIQALEMGSEVQTDAPEEAPVHYGYGKGEKRPPAGR